MIVDRWVSRLRQISCKKNRLAFFSTCWHGKIFVIFWGYNTLVGEAGDCLLHCVLLTIYRRRYLR